MGGTDRAYKYHLHHLFSVQELGGIKKRNLVEIWFKTELYGTSLMG